MNWTARQRGRARNRFSISRHFRGDPRGTAMVEFALIVPVALILFTGTVIYGDAIAIDRKVTLTARTVTDLVTQYGTISYATLQTVLSASSLIIAPYSGSSIVVTVSEVQTNSAGAATITWSYSTPNGTPRPQGQSVTLPAAIDTANVTYIWGEVSYTDTPAVGYQVTGSITLTDQTYMAPRISTTIPVTFP